MVPSGLVMVIFSPLAGYLIRVLCAKIGLIIGTLVMIGGYVSRVFIYDTIAAIIIGSTVVGVGIAIAYAGMPANGLNTLIRVIGQSTSSAATTAIFASVTMQVDDLDLQTFDAFEYIFWLSAAALATAMLVTIFIPRDDETKRTLEQERIRQGNIGVYR